jgi:hypothetical protein
MFRYLCNTLQLVVLCFAAFVPLNAQTTMKARGSAVAGTQAATRAASNQLPNNARVQTPKAITVNGVLMRRDKSNSPSIQAVTFALYKAQQGGASLWEETQKIQIRSDGTYTAFVGAGTSDGIPVELFSGTDAHWLGVRVRNQKEQPRIMLISVPLTLEVADAGTFGGKPAAACIALNSIAATQHSEETNPAPTPNHPVSAAAAINASGNANVITKFIDTAGDIGNSLLFDNGISVGLNNTSPRAAGLDVNGEIIANNRLTLSQDLSTTSPSWHLDNSVSRFRLFWQPDINTAGSEVLTATTAGNVGIGLSTPVNKLDVGGNIGIVGNGNGIHFADGSVQTTASIRGPAGQQGPPGQQGPLGPQGPAGPPVKTFAACVLTGTVLCSNRITVLPSPCVVTSDTGQCSVVSSGGSCAVCRP